MLRPDSDASESPAHASKGSAHIQPKPGAFDPRFVMVNPDPKQAAHDRPKAIEPRPPPDSRHSEQSQSQTKQPETPKSVDHPKSTSTIQRPFPCTFAQYNCPAAFTSKNEWKRHISTKHIQLGFWRCDMCPPSPGIDAPVFNDFNRKDLFTQHLRRMHGGAAALAMMQGKDGQTPSQGTPLVEPTTPGTPSNMLALTEEQIAEIQKRCYRQLRQPPHQSSCVFCSRTFTGANSWEERLEHVGGHLERERKNGTAGLDVSSWREDHALRDYLLDEGIIDYDQHGRYRIGDGKPRRQSREMFAHMPLMQGGLGTAVDFMAVDPRMGPESRMKPGSANSSFGNSQQSGIQMDTESEGSTGTRQRRRGRPPKRHSAADTDSPLRLAIIEDHLMSDISPGDRELRPKALEPSFSQPAPSPQFPPMPPMQPMQLQSMSPMQPMQPMAHLQPREGVSTRRQEKMLAEAAASRPPLLLAPAPLPQSQPLPPPPPQVSTPIHPLSQGGPPVLMSPPLAFSQHPQMMHHGSPLPNPLSSPLQMTHPETPRTPLGDDSDKPRAQGRSFREVIM